MFRRLLLLSSLIVLASIPSAAQRNVPRIPPANDNYANATPLLLPSSIVNTNVFGATVEGTDPDPSCIGVFFNTVWYTVTPAADGLIVFDTTTSNYDTWIGVFTGAPGSFAEVACDADGAQAASVSFPVTSGTTYAVLVGSTFPLGGGESLNIAAQLTTPPANDARAAATVISSSPFTNTVNMSASSVETVDNLAVCTKAPLKNSVWYKISPAAYTRLTVSATAPGGTTPLINAYIQVDGEWVSMNVCPSSGAQTFLAEPGRETYVQIGSSGTAVSTNVTITSALVTTYNFTVNSTADTRDATLGDGVCADGNGVCTLRAAIREGNSHPTGITRITVPAGTYTLNLPGENEDAAFAGDLDLTAAIVIEGAGAGSTIIDANHLDRAFEIFSRFSQVKNLSIVNGFLALSPSRGFGGGLRCTVFALIDGVEISGSHFAGTWDLLGGGAYLTDMCVLIHGDIHHNAPGVGAGAGLYVERTFILSTEIHHNQSGDVAAGMFAHYAVLKRLDVHHNVSRGEFSAYPAGGIWLYHSSLYDSLLSANDGTNGSALQLSGVGRVVNVTITGSPIESSVIGIPQAFNVPTSYDLIHVTVSQNYLYDLNSFGHTAFWFASTAGMGREIRLRNSLVSGNQYLPICTYKPELVSLGNNILDCATVVTNPTDILTGEPLLGPLMDNGGPTLSLMPLPTSPAIDAVQGGGCLPSDQRGVPRPQGAACDIGAVEFDLGANIYATPAAVTIGEGGDSSYRLALSALPSADVDVHISGPSGVELSLTGLAGSWSNSVTRTFTPANWSALKFVFVRVTDDQIVNGQRQALLVHTLSSADGDYDGRSFDYTLTITDNDWPGIGLSQSGVSLTEGANTTYTVFLSSEPEENVTVHLQADAQTEISSDGTAFSASFNLNFTPENWDAPQTVTVRTIDDDLIEGNHSGSIQHGSASADSVYNGKSNTLNVNITDNDTTSSLDLLQPADNAVVTMLQPVFIWSRYLDSTSYRLRVRDSFGAVIISETFPYSAICVSLTCTLDFADEALFLENNEFYSWEVRATGSFGDFNSATNYFQVQPPKPAAFNLIEPANATTIDTLTPSFIWNVAEGAASYQLRVLDSADARVVNHKFTVTSTPAIGNVCDADVCTVALSDLGITLDNREDYEWQVIAANPNGKTKSVIYSFSIQLVLPAPFALLAPDNNGVLDTLTPIFSWELSPLATKYQLRVLDSADARAVNHKFTAVSIPSMDDICDDNVCTVSLTDLGLGLENGEDYVWQVIASNMGGKTKSAKRVLEIIIPRPTIFELLAPANDGTAGSLTPTLQWQQSTGATKYQIRIMNANDVVVFKHNRGAAEIDCSDDICTLDTSGLPFVRPLKDGSEYEWFVTAVNGGGKRKSSLWTFIVSLSSISRSEGVESAGAAPLGFRQP
jgi:CSLREA domain-containing protein